MKRRRFESVFSRTLIVILSVFMLIGNYTPIIADDYSFDYESNLTESNSFLDEILGNLNNIYKAPTNNNADGSDVTVSSWADLKSVIEGWTDLAKPLKVRISGAIAADSPITVTKNVEIIGENNAIIYGKSKTVNNGNITEVEEFDQMFLVNGGTLTLGEGLTLSGKRTTTSSEICYVDNSNSNINYVPNQEEVKVEVTEASNVTYTPTKAAEGYDFSGSGVTYTAAGFNEGIIFNTSSGKLSVRAYNPTGMKIGNHGYHIQNFKVDKFGKVYASIGQDFGGDITGDYYIRYNNVRQKTEDNDAQDGELHVVTKNDQNQWVDGGKVTSVVKDGTYVIYFPTISDTNANMSRYLKDNGVDSSNPALHNVGTDANLQNALILTAASASGDDNVSLSKLNIAGADRGANLSGLFKPIESNGSNHINVLASPTDANEVAAMAAGSNYYLKSGDKYLKLNSAGNASWQDYNSANDASYKWTLVERNGVDVLVNESISGNPQAVYMDGSLKLVDLNGIKTEEVPSSLKINGGTEIKANLAHVSNTGSYTDSNVFENGTANITVYTDNQGTTEASTLGEGTYYLGSEANGTKYFLRYTKENGIAEWKNQDTLGEWFQWKYIDGKFYSQDGNKVIFFDGEKTIIETVDRVITEEILSKLTIGSDNTEIKANLAHVSNTESYTDSNIFESGTANITVYTDNQGTTEASSPLVEGASYYLGTKSGDNTYYLRYTDANSNGKATWVNKPSAGMGEWFEWKYTNGKLVSKQQNKTIVFDNGKAYILGEGGCRIGDPNNPSSVKWEGVDYNHKKTEVDESNGYKGYFIKAINRATINLAGAVLRDFNTVNDNANAPEMIAPILIEASTLNMNKGSIENNNVSYTADDNRSGGDGGTTDNELSSKNPTRSAGAIIFTRGASNSEAPGIPSLGNIHSDAEIKQNRGDAGAMIIQGNSYVTLGGSRTTTENSDCVINTELNGGKINQNLGFHYAGAVLVEDGATFRMVGSTSEMNNNATWNRGGAVWATDFGTNGDGKGADVPWRIKKLLNAKDNRWKDLEGNANEGKFIMDAGIISENTAFKRGGAIDVESNSVYLNGGTISNNYCRERGGAIYVEGDSRSLVKRDKDGNIVYENGVDYFNDVYSYILNIKKGYIGDNYAVTYRGDSLNDTVSYHGEEKTNLELNKILDRKIANVNEENPISNTSANNTTENRGLIGPWGGRDYGGLGGGIWSCSATGLDLLNFADGNDVYIVNNHATGSANGAGRKIEGEIGTDLYIQNGTGQVVTGQLNNQQWINEVTGKPLNNNDVVDDRMYFKNNTSGISANSVDGVDIYGNLSREGGAIALNGNVIFGKMTNTYQNSVQVEFKKQWGQGANKDAVSFKLYFVANDNTEVEVSNFTLDGIPTSEDQDADPSVLWQEINPSTQIMNNDTWAANLQIPSSMVYNDVEYVLYKLNHTTKGEIDPSTKEGNQLLIEAAHADPNGFTIVPGSVRLLVKEFDKNGALIDTVSFESLQLKSVSAQTKEITDNVYEAGNACPVSSTQVTVNTSLTTFTMGAINDEPSIEKYVNNVVHDTLNSFNDVIEYEIMAYVPYDAEEVIIYDTLEQPLMFVSSDKLVTQYVDNNGQDALNSNFVANNNDYKIINNSYNAPSGYQLVYINENNHIGDGVNGSVMGVRGDTHFNGKDNLLLKNNVLIGNAPTYDNDGYVIMPTSANASGNTLYVKIDGEDIVGLRGKWVRVKFNAAVKPSYRDIDKLKSIGWASEEDPKQGSVTSGEVLSLLDAYLEANNETIDKIRTKDNRYYVKSNKGNFYQVNIGSTLWHKTELLNGTTLRPIDGSDAFTHDINCGLEGYYNVQAVFGEGQNASWNPPGTDLTAEQVGALRGGYNNPVINALQPHSGEKNQAQYSVKTTNNAKSNHKSNIVTVDVVSPEKYVNNKVHDDIVYFDEVFEYEIMVYVPEDAARVTIYDTLGDSLMFVDNSGARQYVLDAGGNQVSNTDISNEDAAIRQTPAGNVPGEDDYTGIFNNWLWQGEGNNQVNKSMVYNGEIGRQVSLEYAKENAVIKSRGTDKPYVMKLDDRYYVSSNNPAENHKKVWRDITDSTDTSDKKWITDYNNNALSVRINNSNILDTIGINKAVTVNQLVVHDDNNHKGNGVDGTVMEDGTPIDIIAGMIRIGNMSGGSYPNNDFNESNTGNSIYLDINNETVLNQVRGKWLTLKYKAAIKPSAFKAIADKIASGNTDDDASINWKKISYNGYIQEPATLTDGLHSGLANTANYIVVDAKGTHKSETNTVTVTPEVTELEVTKKWLVEEGYNQIPSVEDFKNKLKLYWDKSVVEFDDVHSEVTHTFADKLTVDDNGNVYETDSYNWKIKWTDLPKLREYYVREIGISGFEAPKYYDEANNQTPYAKHKGTIVNKELKDKLPYEVYALKNLIGKDLVQGKFDFEIFDIVDTQGNHYDANGNKTSQASVSITASNNADGSIYFGNINLPTTVDKEYIIKIREIEPTNKPTDLQYVEYDKTVREIRVKVVKDKDSLVDELKTAKQYITNSTVKQYQYEDNGGNVTIVEPLWAYSYSNGYYKPSSGYHVFIKDDSGILVAGWKQTDTTKESVTVYLTEGTYTVYSIDSSNVVRARDFKVVRNSNGKLDIAKVKLEDGTAANGDALGYIWYEEVAGYWTYDRWGYRDRYIPGYEQWYGLIDTSKYKYDGESVLIPLSTNATFENKVDTTKVTVNKTFDDFGDADAVLPNKIEVNLYYKVEGDPANETPKKVDIEGVNPQFLTADGGWTYTWNDLPIKKDGKVITYYVKETAPKNWKPATDWTAVGVNAATPISASGVHLSEENPWTTISNSQLYSADNSVVTKIIVEGKLYYLDENGALASTPVGSQKAKDLEKNDYERLLWRAHDYGVTNTQRITIKFQSVKDETKWLHGRETSTNPYTGTVSVVTGKANATTFYLVVSGTKTNAMFFWKNNDYVYYLNGNLSNTECGYHEVKFQKPNTYETFESTHEIDIENEWYPEYKLPNSGGIGTYIFTIAGIMFLTLAFEKIFGFKKIK